jgi:molecular chaperone Hsp33
MNDMILRATAAQDQFRVIATNSTNTVQRARDLHDLSPIATLLMGRLISATAMMSTELKIPGASITLKLDCEGDLKGAIVTCEHGAMIRGYAREPQLFYEETHRNLELGKAVGKGNLSIIKDLRLKSPSTGICALVTGEIGEDLAHYYLQSEQIPSAVNLGVLFDNQANVRSSGGYIIQQMPFADQAIADSIISNIRSTPNITDLMDMGYDIEQILSKFVLKGIDWTIKDNIPLSYTCNCSQEKFASALLTLGISELRTLQDGIDTVCSYCNKTYTFSNSEIAELVRILKSGQD